MRHSYPIKTRTAAGDGAGPVNPHVAFWVLGSGIMLATLLASVPLAPIDETRYAGVAWEMLQHGQWLVPHNNGAAYPDKPPLLFWLLGAGWEVFGTSALWARLVPVGFALATLAVTAALARTLWTGRPRAAWLAPTVLLGFALWAAWTPLVMFDVLLTFWVTTAMLGLAWAGLHHQQRGWWLFGAAIGLGILTKGPVMVLHVLPGALLAPLWIHPARTYWRTWYPQLALGVTGGILIALAWAVPAALVGGKTYAEAIFWGQSAGRIHASFAHAHPDWWYLAILLIILYPWAYWPTLWSALARLRPRRDAGVRFVLCWILPVFAAFSLISGKQIQYLLPLLPAVALVFAHALAERPGRARTISLLPLTGVMILLALALPFIPMLASHFGWPDRVATLSWLCPAAILGLATLLSLAGTTIEQRTLTIAAVSVGLVAILAFNALSSIAPRLDLRPVSRIVAVAQQHGLTVAHVGDYDDRLHFFGHLKKSVKVLHHGPQVNRWSDKHPDSLVVIYFHQKPRFPASLDPVYVQPFRGRWLVVLKAANVQQATSVL